MTTVPQEIIDMVIGFLAHDRPSLLACSLAGSSFYPPSRAHLFAEIEVGSLQRFQGLLELSSDSLATFNHESFKPFSSVRTISVQGADGWIRPELLPSLLFLPLLAPFPNVKDFRIDSLTLPGYIEAEGSLMAMSKDPVHTWPSVGSEVGRRFGISRGIPTNESIADPRDFPSTRERQAACLEALSLGNCRAPSLRWFLRYLSSFPDLKSLSLIDFTWGSVMGGDVDQCPSSQLSQPRLLPPRGLSELTLKIQYASLVACAPSLLFESLSRSLRILRLVHIDLFLSVGQLTALKFENGVADIYENAQTSTRVRSILTHRTLHSHRSTFSHTFRSHRSQCGSKRSNDGFLIFYRRSQAQLTLRNLTSISSSLRYRSKSSWMQLCGHRST